MISGSKLKVQKGHTLRTFFFFERGRLKRRKNGRALYHPSPHHQRALGENKRIHLVMPCKAQRLPLYDERVVLVERILKGRGSERDPKRRRKRRTTKRRRKEGCVRGMDSTFSHLSFIFEVFHRF